MYTTWKVTHPSRAGTTKHMYKKRKTKQGTTPGSGQQLPCEVNYLPLPRRWQTWKHTTLKYKKVKIKCIKRKKKLFHRIAWTSNEEHTTSLSRQIINVFQAHILRSLPPNMLGRVHVCTYIQKVVYFLLDPESNRKPMQCIEDRCYVFNMYTRSGSKLGF